MDSLPSKSVSSSLGGLWVTSAGKKDHVKFESIILEMSFYTKNQLYIKIQIVLL